ncbi:MAG: hypothetical protein WA949_07360 [Phormidesmis sp.]
MAIANYTTKVSQKKTVSEIQDMLAEAGAKSLSVEYVDKQPVGIAFTVDLGDGYLVPYRVPCNWRGVLVRLRADAVSGQYRNEDQARRVAWRITRDWLRAQIALTEAGQADLAEVFLPYAIHSSGRTLYQIFQDDGFPALAPDQ